MNWLWKKLGYHVCEEFTQWETRQENFTRPVRDMTERIKLGWVTTVEYTKRWQERRCTICGVMEQRSLGQ